MSGTCLKDVEDWVYPLKEFWIDKSVKIIHALIWSRERKEYHPHAVALLDNRWIMDCSYGKVIPFMSWAKGFKAKRMPRIF